MAQSTGTVPEGKRVKFKSGDMVPTTVMKAVTGEAISLPDPKRLVHLQFRRFVDCPICNTHIAELRKRAREIAPSGRIKAVKYGTDAYDQWSVDELLTFSKGVGS
jgi:peroxiredoxin